MTDTTTVAGSSRELPLEPAGEVQVILTSSRVRLRGTDTGVVSVRTTDGSDIDEEVVLEQEGAGRVRIRDADRGVRLGPMRMRMRGGRALEIEVPRAARLTFRTLSGDVEAEGMDGDCRWASASGDLHLTVDGGTHAVDSMSGEVIVEAAASIGVRARTVSGDLRIRAPRIDALGATTTSGDIRVEAALGEDGEHALTSVSGDVELATPSPVRIETRTITGDVRVIGRHGAEGGRGRRVVVLGAGSARLTVRTTSGDILVRGEGTGRVPAPPEPLAPAEAPAPPAAPEPPRPGEVTTRDPAPAPAYVVAEAEAAPNLVRPADAGPGAWQGGDRAEDRREAARLDILRALERGDLDVDTASRRLEVLDEAGPRHVRGFC